MNDGCTSKNEDLIAMRYTCFSIFIETDTVPSGKCHILKGKTFPKRALEAFVLAGFTEVLMKQGGIEECSCLSKGGGSQ